MLCNIHRYCGRVCCVTDTGGRVCVVSQTRVCVVLQRRVCVVLQTQALW